VCVRESPRKFRYLWFLFYQNVCPFYYLKNNIRSTDCLPQDQTVWDESAQVSKNIMPLLTPFDIASSLLYYVHSCCWCCCCCGAGCPKWSLWMPWIQLGLSFRTMDD
jgi:hypothetical protein